MQARDARRRPGGDIGLELERGRAKVNSQWLLFCLVHHTEKLTRTGYAA